MVDSARRTLADRLSRILSPFGVTVRVSRDDAAFLVEAWADIPAGYPRAGTRLIWADRASDDPGLAAGEWPGAFASAALADMARVVARLVSSESGK